jgi:drug/metabolite transporter (DMT)-like permease
MHVLSHLAILGATLLWASSFAAAKFGVDEMPASEIQALRFAIATALVWPAVLARRSAVPWREIAVPGFFMGAMSPGIATLFFYWGLLTTASVNAVVIAAWMPLVTSLMARFLIGEKISVQVVAGSVVALAGIGLLVSDDAAAGGSLKGDALCIAGLLIMCLSQTYMRRLNRDHADPLAITAWQLTGGAAVSLVAMVGFESWLDTRGLMAVPSLAMWLLIGYLAVFVSLVTYLLNNYGLRRMQAAQSSLYYVLMAPLGAPISYIWLGEPISARDLAAIALVVAGVAIPAVIAAWRDGYAAARR